MRWLLTFFLTLIVSCAFPSPVLAYIETNSTSFLLKTAIILLVSLFFSINFALKFIDSKSIKILSLVLLSFCSPLFIYSQNINKVAVTQISITLVTIFASVMIGYWLLSIIFKYKSRLSFTVAAISLILFFSYGHVYAFIRNYILMEGKFGTNFYLPIFYLSLLIVSSLLLSKRSSKLTKLSKAITLFNFLLFTTIIINLLISIITSTRQSATPPAVATSQELPDIYYIIFDEYARQDTLKEIFDFDNQEMVDFLKSKDFYVASDSYANYSITFSALSSSLNIDYLDSLIKPNNLLSKNRPPFYQLITDNQVAKILKNHGYQTIYLSRKSWNPLGMGSRYTDIDIDSNEPNQFVKTFLATTALNPFFTTSSLKPYLPSALKQEPFKTTLQVFEKLKKIPQNPKPTFTYAHIFLPHTPYYFNRDGELNSGNITRPNPDLYLEQLIFTNTKIKELIVSIQENSKIKPIILLQSDTGPNLHRNMTTSFSKLTVDQIQERFGILSAYYFPGKNKDIFYDSITPVNSFRLLLNQYFDAKLPLREDKHYFVNYNNLYKFYPINLLK